MGPIEKGYRQLVETFRWVGRAEIRAAGELRSADDRRSLKLTEHQFAIAELRRLVNAEQAKVIDLPDVLQRRGLN